VGSNFINQADGNIYPMQVSPSHSGQPISPQWITPTTDHPLPLVAPFHQGADFVPTQAQTQIQTDPVVQLLDQQAWHGLELYESFGAIPDNNMTMLDYFSTTPLGLHDGGLGSGGGGHVGGMVQQNANVLSGGPNQGPAGGHDMVGVWPDSLTNSILNFQPNFHDLGDFTSWGRYEMTVKKGLGKPSGTVFRVCHVYLYVTDDILGFFINFSAPLIFVNQQSMVV
jgi:hypothetical protein